MRVSTLKAWINRSYAVGYLKKGLESLQPVSINYLFEKSVENLDEENEPTQTQHSTTSCDNLNYFKCSQASNGNNQSDEAKLFEINKSLDSEISIFSDILGNQLKLKKIKKTSEFWKENKTLMPNLFELQIILLNLPATSSFIERFFSISGIVCDVRRLNMTDDLVIKRSMMKANMNILRDLNKIQK